RYVSYDVESTGADVYNSATPGDATARDYYETNYPEYSAFFNGNGSARSTSGTNSYTKVLPSFNLSVSLTDEIIARLAISQAVSYANLYDLRNTRTYNPVVSIPLDSTTGEVDEENVSLSASGQGGNPYLQPEESTQFDVTTE